MGYQADLLCTVNYPYFLYSFIISFQGTASNQDTAIA